MNEDKFYWIDYDPSTGMRRYRSYINGSTGPWRMEREAAIEDGERHVDAIKAIFHPGPEENPGW